MPEINICNDVGRDAAVNMESVAVPLRVRWLDASNRQARNIRVLKSTIDYDIDALTKQNEGIENVAQALIDGDPEINLEQTGSFLTATSRVFVDKDFKLVHRIQQFDVIFGPDGDERERRPRETAPTERFGRHAAQMDRHFHQEIGSRPQVRICEQDAAHAHQRIDVRLFVWNGQGPGRTRKHDVAWRWSQSKSTTDSPSWQLTLSRLSRGPNRRRKVLPFAASFKPGTEISRETTA